MVVAEAGPPSAGYTVTGATLGDDSRFVALLDHTVTFISAEAHAASWAWDFGDGSTASGAAVTHKFETVGSPNVTLTVTGDGTNTIGTSGAAIGFNVQDPAVLYLGPNGRYQVRAIWSSTAQSTSGVGTGINLTTDTGYFWFFSPSNLEVVAKVLDACSVDGNIWAFAGGLTNLHVELTVTDSQTGATKTYTNPEGTAFAPIQDTQFETCPAGGTPRAARVSPRRPRRTLRPSSSRHRRRRTPSWETRSPSRRRPRASPARCNYKWDFGDLPANRAELSQHAGTGVRRARLSGGRHVHRDGHRDLRHPVGDGLAVRGRVRLRRDPASLDGVHGHRRFASAWAAAT